MLKIENLKKAYPGGFTLDVSLQTEPGRITGVIGENGAGKTTLFKAVLQLIHPDSGRIELFGKDIGTFTAEDKRLIGVALADSGFSGFITTRDVAAIKKQFYPAFDEARFLEQCRRFGLPDNKQIKAFSSGMQAKLKVLTALSHGARFLVLDEPTAGLDVPTREDVTGMLQDYLEEDDTRSVLISSHISTDLESLCDDFYMIHHGTVVLHEETDRLLSEYAVLKVSEEAYDALDKQYLLYRKKEPFGYLCLTNARAFYMENAPDVVMEKSGIDELILLIVRGERVTGPCAETDEK